MIHFDKNTLKTCKESLEPLFLDQYKENEDGQWGLDPDYERYFALEDHGIVHLYVARDEDKPIGYMIVLVQDHLHHRGIKYAVADIFYVTPEYRRSMIAYNLIETVENDLREMGVKRFLIAMKLRHQFRKLLTLCGFYPEEELWEKSL